MASQSMNVAANIAMAVLVLTGTIALWHVYLGAVLIGVGMSLNAPARQSALPSLVPAEDLQHAVVLNTATLNIGQAIGPAIGGLLVATVGIDGAYVAQALLFVIASALIRRIDLPDIVRIGPTSSWRSSAGDGVRYLRHHPVLPKLFLMSLIPLVFVQPFRAVVPAIAVDDLQLGPSGTGLLLASVGVGAVLSVVAMATLPPIRRSGLAIGVCTVGFAVTTALFAMTSVFLLALIVMFAGGVLQAVSRTLTQSMLLEQTEDAFRGRMSSVYVVNRGMMPVGSTMLAGLTPLLGAARSVSTMALIGAVVAGVVGWRSRSTWQQ